MSTSTLYPIQAYSYASTFTLKELAGWFPDGVRIRSKKTYLILEWSRESFAFAFDFGALVFVNVSAETKASILRVLDARLMREPHPPFEENFLVEMRDGASVEVAFDRVVVPALTPVTIEVIATVLAQSVALDYYDEDAQAIMNRVGTLATEIAGLGKPRGKSQDLIRFVAQAIVSQVEIISAISLLDKPDATWEDELADKLHEKMRANLEIPERYRALEAKLHTIREANAAFLDMSSQRRMLWLEIVVVVLILLEVVMGVVRVH